MIQKTRLNNPLDMIQKKHNFLTLFFLLSLTASHSQDAFFTQFFNKRSFYNPAMTGINNSLSYKISHKSQWNGQGHTPYKSLLISMEDAMPCSNVDWGVYALGDKEGSSTFSTYQAGAKFSYSLTELIPSVFSQHNIRLGIDLSIGQHRVDYTKLVFSDQIDQKYGVVLPTSFVPPEGIGSALFFTPGFGAVWQARWNKKSSKSLLTTIGASLSNSFALGGKSVGQSSSVLGIPNIYKQVRFSFFAEFDFLPYYKKNLYVNISPLIFYQRQGGIDYWEIGTSVDISSIIQTGIYIHNTGFGSSAENTNWLSIMTSANLRTSNKSKLVLDFTYSTNYGGLQNQVGSIIELGLTWHFARSLGCKLLGKEDEVYYNSKTKCPTLFFSPGRRKMYENIWYRN